MANRALDALERVAHRMCQRCRVRAASDGFMRSAATEIGEGALFVLAKDGDANVTKVIAQGVARVGRARPIAEDVGVAVKLDADDFRDRHTERRACGR